MVAEKPSIADALAVALCEDSSQKNSSKKCGVPVHTFTGTSFRGTFPRFSTSSSISSIFTMNSHDVLVSRRFP